MAVPFFMPAAFKILGLRGSRTWSAKSVRSQGEAEDHAVSHAARVKRRSLLTTAAIALFVTSCTVEEDKPAPAVEILAFGILAYDEVAMRQDESSSVGAKRGGAKGLRVLRQTDRIPLRPGVSYGVAFVLKNVPAEQAQVRVVLRSSNPCVLKASGETVYHNDTTLTVKVGQPRHIGARIPASADENHCAGDAQPGTNTFELYLGYQKLAEKALHIYRE